MFLFHKFVRTSTIDSKSFKDHFKITYPSLEDRIIPISREFGEEPVWSVSGDKLLYRNRNKWMAVAISTEPEFNPGTPHVVFEGPYLNVAGLSYDVAPDGQRFLVLSPQCDDSHIRELHIVTNWF